MSEYAAFLDARRHANTAAGFDPIDVPDFLFPFQRDLVSWAIEQGRAGIFADCGLGKTPMQLVWADNVARHTGGNVLVLTPLAVSQQTIKESEKFGIDATRSATGDAHRITVTNYERLHYFDPKDFAGVVCDESSILKSFDGVRRREITSFMRKMKYRLLCTATAAPNDYTELGTSAEAIGFLGYVDMLNKFFVNDLNNSATGAVYGKQIKWRLKGHAEEPFWRWVCSWARAIRRPSDYGYEDDGFILPALTETEHMVEANRPPDGMLFSLPAVGLREQREERRRTLTERCERVAELVDHDRPALVWCNLNDEGDALERMIPDAVQVAGSDSNDDKEAKLLAFAAGDVRCLVTKPKIGAWGLNFQHCAHVTFFPSHSFEQYYQGVRRCWRFGQTSPVQVDMVTTEGMRGVLDNLQRKAKAADAMFERLVELMGRSLHIESRDDFNQKEEVPAWLSQIS